MGVLVLGDIDEDDGGTVEGPQPLAPEDVGRVAGLAPGLARWLSALALAAAVLLLAVPGTRTDASPGARPTRRSIRLTVTGSLLLATGVATTLLLRMAPDTVTERLVASLPEADAVGDALPSLLIGIVELLGPTGGVALVLTVIGRDRRRRRDAYAQLAALSRAHAASAARTLNAPSAAGTPRAVDRRPHAGMCSYPVRYARPATMTSTDAIASGAFVPAGCSATTVAVNSSPLTPAKRRVSPARTLPRECRSAMRAVTPAARRAAVDLPVGEHAYVVAQRRRVGVGDVDDDRSVEEREVDRVRMLEHERAAHRLRHRVGTVDHVRQAGDTEFDIDRLRRHDRVERAAVRDVEHDAPDTCDVHGEVERGYEGRDAREAHVTRPVRRSRRRARR